MPWEVHVLVDGPTGGIGTEVHGPFQTVEEAVRFKWSLLQRLETEWKYVSEPEVISVEREEDGDEVEKDDSENEGDDDEGDVEADYWLPWAS